MGAVTTYVGATEAARMLGVAKPTLYAYVSRGMLRRETAVDGRTSLYAREDVERLAARGRRRQAPERPTIDVQVSSAITHLHDERVTYRGHDVADLATSCSYEQIAELLLTGVLPPSSEPWAVDRGALERCRKVVDAAGGRDALLACGRPYVGHYRGPLLAYGLDVEKRRVGFEPRPPGVVFASRRYPGAPVEPLTAGGFRPVLRNRSWTLLLGRPNRLPAPCSAADLARSPSPPAPEASS